MKELAHITTANHFHGSVCLRWLRRQVQIPRSLFSLNGSLGGARVWTSILDSHDLGDIDCLTRVVENDTWQVSISAMDTETAMTSTLVSGSETLAFSWETFKPEKGSISRFMGTGIRRNRKKVGAGAILGPQPPFPSPESHALALGVLSSWCTHQQCASPHGACAPAHSQRVAGTAVSAFESAQGHRAVPACALSCSTCEHVSNRRALLFLKRFPVSPHDFYNR